MPRRLSDELVRMRGSGRTHRDPDRAPRPSPPSLRPRKTSSPRCVSRRTARPDWPPRCRVTAPACSARSPRPAPRRTPSHWFRRGARNDVPRTHRTDATTTSSRAAEPTSPSRPPNAADGALFDAIATAQASIYGYGIVSAHSVPDDELSGVVIDGSAPQTARGGLGDAASPIGGRPTACGRISVADRGRQPDGCGESRGADGGGRRRRVASRRRAGERRTGARVRGQRADGLRGQGSPVEPRSGPTPITVAFPGGSE